VLGTLITFAVAVLLVDVIIVGVLTDALGWRTVFVVMSALAAATLLLIALALHRFAPAGAAARSFRTLLSGYGVLIRSPVFLALQGGLSPGSFTAIMAAGPYLMVEVMGRPATEFSLYFALVTVVYMAMNHVGGRLSPRFGIERLVLVAGLISAAAALAGLAWFAMAGLGVAVIFPISTDITVGNGLAQPNAQADAMKVKPEVAGTA